MYAYMHKYSIHVYRPRRMAFEAGRGTGRTPRDSEGTRRTALPDPRGLPTDAGRNWRRTLQDLEGRPVLPGLLRLRFLSVASGNKNTRVCEGLTADAG